MAREQPATSLSDRQGSVRADELVTFQGGGDVESRFRGVEYLLITHDFADATETYDLVRRDAQCDDVLKGAADVGFPFGSEQHAAGTDVLGITRLHNAIHAGARYGKGELEGKPPGTSLFH